MGLVDQLRAEEADLLRELKATLGPERARAAGSLQLTEIREGMVYLKRVYATKDTSSGMSSRSLGNVRLYGGEDGARRVLAMDRRLREVRAMLKLIERGVLAGGSAP